MRRDETVFRCAVCNFESGFGNVINDHMIVQHTEIRVVTAYRPDRIYITVVKKTGEEKPDMSRVSGKMRP